MKKPKPYLLIFFLVWCSSGFSQQQGNSPPPYYAGIGGLDPASVQKTIAEIEKSQLLTAGDIHLTKELLYDKYTLDDVYPYKDTTRCFQWDKIKVQLANVENISNEEAQWAILQNYKNRNGEAPLVKRFERNKYNRVTDTLGVQRYQSVPLYLLTDTLQPEIYGRDGEPVRYLEQVGSFVKVAPAYTGGTWYVPLKYVKLIPDSITRFKKVVAIDRHNQNIASMENTGRGQWVVRSMNPATTGKNSPPYSQRTPLGLYLLQEKKVKMIFLKDGSQETGGFAPYANRFCNGGYIHGVPTNVPQTGIIEYSQTLGTIPRSHMCVRNATSHAKFIYEWAPVNESIIFVLE